jgi:hypothetical protein
MDERIKIEYVSANKLINNVWNPNRVDPVQMDKIVESLRTRKFFKPVLVRRNSAGEMEIIGGQHRVQAAIQLGIKEVPIVDHGMISDAEAKIMTIQDNARYGEDDPLAMADIFEDPTLGSAESLLAILPYDESDLIGFMEHVTTGLELLDGSLIDDDEGIGIDLDYEGTSPTKTSQILRFKIPVADADKITALIHKVKAENGFTEGDDLTNAGDALVHLLTGVASE